MLKREVRLNSRLEAARLILGRMKRDHSKLQTALAGAEYDLEVLDNIRGPSKAADNAATIKSWGVPGSKVKQRVTERAEAKAAEEKELFVNLARFLYRRFPIHSLAAAQGEGPEFDWLENWLNKEAARYTNIKDDPFARPYGQALRAIERQEQEDEAQ